MVFSKPSAFLVKCLQDNMGDKLRYCEGHEQTVDWYEHNFLKFHDFDLNFNPPSHWDTIVQIRHPFPSMTSWFNLQTLNYGHPDTYEAWTEWAVWSFRYWRKFVRRWCLNEMPIIIIDYNDLMSNTKHYVGNLKRLLCGDSSINVEPEINPLRDYRDFRFYKKEDFDFFGSLCAFEMRLLGYK